MDPSAQPNNQANHDVRYERRDTRFKPLVYSVVGLTILVLAAVAVTNGVFRVLATRTNRIPENPVDVIDDDIAGELHAMREKEEKLLSSYGWISKEKGIAHIPIERAMELVVEETRAR